MRNIILFDLGDTLIFRNRDHRSYDLDLISDKFKVDQSTISEALNMSLSAFPGVYSPWKDNSKIRTLSEERQYYASFYTQVFQSLSISQNAESFVEIRLSQQRYFLFPETKAYLKKLYQHGFLLGIFTNGRPSRRLIIKQLNINEFIDPSLIFISDEIGLYKPDPKSFAYVKQHAPDTNIALCDDELPNLSTASQMNWGHYQIDHNQSGFKVLDILVK
ncbi:MAG: HAD family hydrolase [Candidatus Paceibacterota bacterium]|jgi:HAD superfamily hydrolase (TIGR01549 family)